MTDRERSDTASSEAFRIAMRHVVSPVAVVTFATAEGWDGLTSTAICSVTTEPPSVAVSIKTKTFEQFGIHEGDALALNFLSDEQSEIARQFSPSAARGERFSSGIWSQGGTGAPILEEAVSSFDCRIQRILKQGLHTICIAAVVTARTAEGSSLLYRDGFFRRIIRE